VEDASYTGAVLGESINVRLFLPPCYEVSETSYPALYLLHGWPYDETHWDILGAVQTAAQKMVDGSWPPFILVMPYAPTLLFTGTDGGSWSYEGEFVDGLVPWVDASYRTIPEPTARGFAGISRGGIWSLEVSLLHPDVVDAVAALSPAFAYNQGREAYDPFRLLYRGEPRPQHLLLTAGETDWAREETIRFSQQLDLFAIEHELLITPGSHGDETWMQVMEEVLGFFAAIWEVDSQPSS
jgi:enterochelin esterase-like enzyme